MRFGFLGVAVDPVGVTVVGSVFHLTAVVVLLPYVGLVRGLMFHLVGSSPRSLRRRTSFSLLRRQFLTCPTLTVKRDRATIGNVTGGTHGGVGHTLSLLNSCSRSGCGGMRRGRGLVSGCRSGLNACLVRLAKRRVSAIRVRRISGFLRAVDSFRHLKSRTIGVSGITGRVSRGGVAFSRSTRGRLSILRTTIERVISLAISTFYRSSLRLTTGVRPLQRLVKVLYGSLGGQRMAELQRKGYRFQRKFTFGSLLAGLREVTTRYSGITMTVVRARASRFSARRCLGDIHRVGSSTCLRYFSSCTHGCDVPPAGGRGGGG